jgi:hypothetical protein
LGWAATRVLVAHFFYLAHALPAMTHACCTALAAEHFSYLARALPTTAHATVRRCSAGRGSWLVPRFGSGRRPGPSPAPTEVQWQRACQGYVPKLCWLSLAFLLSLAAPAAMLPCNHGGCRSSRTGPEYDPRSLLPPSPNLLPTRSLRHSCPTDVASKGWQSSTMPPLSPPLRTAFSPLNNKLLTLFGLPLAPLLRCRRGCQGTGECVPRKPAQRGL